MWESLSRRIKFLVRPNEFLISQWFWFVFIYPLLCPRALLFKCPNSTPGWVTHRWQNFDRLCILDGLNWFWTLFDGQIPCFFDHTLIDESIFWFIIWFGILGFIFVYHLLNIRVMVYCLDCTNHSIFFLRVGLYLASSPTYIFVNRK